jgi:hypothetical protein
LFLAENVSTCSIFKKVIMYCIMLDSRKRYKKLI